LALCERREGNVRKGFITDIEKYVKGGLKMKDSSTPKVNCNECKHFILSGEYCSVYGEYIKESIRRDDCKAL